MCQNLREVEIVGEDHQSALAGISAYLPVGCPWFAHARPMHGIVTSAVQSLNPSGSQVHVNEKPHQLAS